MLSAGSRIVNYEVIELIGSGSQGLVYLCRHTRLDRVDAVKVLLARLTDNPSARARFEREAAHAARLQHPNIATIHDSGETADGFLYVAMRFVEGPDLAKLIRSRELTDQKRIMNIVEGLSRALDAAHAIGLVHRDVKPSNVLIEPDGSDGERAVLVDFGISKWWYELRSSTNTAMGTYAYIAPERIVGHSGDDRSDQYSLACTAYECLTGTPPFPSHNPAQIIKAHLELPPPKASQTNPELTAMADAVLDRALAKNPMDRYPSCGAFVTALRGALDLQPASERTWSTFRSVAALSLPRSVTNATALSMPRAATAVADPAPLVEVEEPTITLTRAPASSAPLPSIPRELSTLALSALAMVLGAYGTLVGSGGRAIGIALAFDLVALVLARVARRRAIRRNQRGRAASTVAALLTVAFAGLLYYPYRAYSLAFAGQVHGAWDSLAHFIQH
jgi:serine/threonine protein kinase